MANIPFLSNSSFSGDIYLGTDSDILKSGTNPFRLYTNGTLALSVSASQNATFTGGITMSNSILISYTGSDGMNRDAGLKIINDANDWGILVDKGNAAGNNFGVRINADGANAFSIYNSAGASKVNFTGAGVADFAGTVTSPTFLGDLNGTINTATTGTTQTAGNNTTLIATTAFVTTAVAATGTGVYLPLAGGTMTGNVIFPGEEANSFKIAFTGASASSGISTVDQSGAGLYIGANSRVNTSGAVVFNDTLLPSSGIYFDGWSGYDMEFYTGSSGNPTKRLTIQADGDAIFTGGVKVNDNSITLKKTRGIATNYATSEGWLAGAVSTFTSRVGYFGGNFENNGPTGENKVEYGLGPFNSRELIWKTVPETGNNSDGGWNKNFTTLPGILGEAGFMSIVYVKRPTADTAGNFYHGCSGSNTLNLDGNANNNPYFQAIVQSGLPENVWCVSIGIIQANDDANTTGSAFGGIYRLDTGAKIFNAGTFKQVSSSLVQSHRVYHYYSTSTTAKLEFAQPGFYAMDGSEPTLSDLTGGAAGGSDVFWSANGTDIYNDNTGSVGIGTTSPDAKLDISGDSITRGICTIQTATPYIQWKNVAGTRLSYIQHDANHLVMQADVGQVRLQTDANNDILITPGGTGNVGIGTNSPTDKLDIAGAARFTSNISFSGTKSGRIYKASNHGLAIHGVAGTENDFAMFTPAGALKIVVPTGTNNVILNPSNGNVGIGTTTPTTRLNTVVSANTDKMVLGTASGGFKVGNTTGNEYGINMGVSNSGASWIQVGRTDGTATAYNLSLQAAGGNVGIGTTNPAQNFVVAEGTNQHGIELVPGTLSYIQAYDRATSDYGDLHIDAQKIGFGLDNGGEKVTFLANGNVGIGTTSPRTKLDVGVTGNLGAVTNKVISATFDGGYSTTNSLQYNVNAFIGTTFGTTDIFAQTSGEVLKNFYTGLIADNSYFNGSRYGIVQGGVERLTVEQGGNVGIGRTDPATKLDVNGKVSSLKNYIYGQDNFHLKLVEDDNPAFVGNIYGSPFIGNASYYGSNIWNVTPTQTALSLMYMGSGGDISFRSSSFTAGAAVRQTPTTRLTIGSTGLVAITNKATSASTVSADAATTLVTKDYVDSSAGNPSHFRQGFKTHTVGTAFSSALTVSLAAHTGCYVTLCCFGDWGGHSSAAYRGEFFLQNGAGIYNEPGIIIRQDDNTSDGTDQIICQILDPAGSTGNRDFVIQIRHTDTTSPASFAGTITFTVQGKFNSVT